MSTLCEDGSFEKNRLPLSSADPVSSPQSAGDSLEPEAPAELRKPAAQQDLLRDRDFSDAVINSLPGVFYLYNEEGKFLRWNRNFERVTGYASEEIEAMHPLDFFSADQREQVAKRIDNVFAAGESSVEADLRCKCGRFIPYHFTGLRTEIEGRTCLMGVGIDLSGRRQAEEAERTSRALYRALFEYAPDGILIADANSTYLDANSKMCEMLGYQRDELIGMGAHDILAVDEGPRIGKALETIKAGLDFHQEWSFRRKDGTSFPAEVRTTTTPDGNLLAVIRDVTQRKQSEQALRELNETLETKVQVRTEELRAALLAAEAADRVKSAFLATMSHELRTPLNSIIGFTGIILQGLAGPLTPEQTKQLGMVRGSSRHLLELINDVLDLSKIEADQLEVRCESFDLKASLRRVIDSVRPLAQQRGLALTLEICDPVSYLISDRRRVEQILLNLLSNALKFTERGRVDLRVEVTESPSSSVIMKVTDTGMGLDSEDLSTIFLPFHQVDTGLTRSHQGTGLGLAICQRLAQLLGGEISVSSQRGVGSEFTVRLPLGFAPCR